MGGQEIILGGHLPPLAPPPGAATGGMLYKLPNSNLISIGLILLTPTVYLKRPNYDLLVKNS